MRLATALILIGLVIGPTTLQTPEAAKRRPLLLAERDLIVATEAQRAGVPIRLAVAVARVENLAADSMAISTAGAIGLMQVMPRYWQNSFRKECGGGSLYERRRNVCVGVRILRQHLRRYSTAEALRRYNGGSGTAYITKVLEQLLD